MNSTEKYILTRVLKNLKDASYMYHHQDETMAQKHLDLVSFYPYMAGYTGSFIDSAIINLEYIINHSE